MNDIKITVFCKQFTLTVWKRTSLFNVNVLSSWPRRRNFFHIKKNIQLRWYRLHDPCSAPIYPTINIARRPFQYYFSISCLIIASCCIVPSCGCPSTMARAYETIPKSWRLKTDWGEKGQSGIAWDKNCALLFGRGLINSKTRPFCVSSIALA